MTPPTRLVPRYLGQRLVGDLDEFHRAVSYLLADTCRGGRCSPQGECGRHAQRTERRRQQQGGELP
jgi:hypothetical protein